MSRPEPSTRAIEGIVFDKDGTLVDFHATWDPLILGLIEALADGDRELLQVAADAVGFDLATGRTHPDSPIIAESNEEIVDRLAPIFGHPPSDAAFLAHVEEALLATTAAAVKEAPGASRVLASLRAAGVPLAVATNDSEASARAQLEHLGWSTHFITVVGYDSGHGAKPDPAMITECAARMGLRVDRVAMVGDSAHDLVAARAAGAIAVLVGNRDDLAGHADIVIDEIEDLCRLIGSCPAEGRG